MKLQWKPPTYDGGSPITGYVIEKRDMKRPTWTNAGKTPKDVTEITVEKLLEGSEYMFRVMAENKKGQSKPCETKAPVVVKSPYGMCLLIIRFEIDKDVFCKAIIKSSPIDI